MLEQWILPVYETDERQSIGGQCFVVDSYLITAAHVIEDVYRPFVVLEEQKLYLTKEGAFVYKHKASEDEDFAVFHLPTKKSPIRMVAINGSDQDYKCLTFRKQDGQEVIMRSSAHIMPTITDRVFICNLDPMLMKGDSGCPIVDKDNNVVGMLVAGDDKSICAFQSGNYILNQISNIL